MIFRALLAIVALVVGGCASTVQQSPTKLYTGSLPPGQSPALVKPAVAVVIEGVDDERVRFTRNAFLSVHDHELQLAPGPHTFDVSFDVGGLKSRSSQRLHASLQAGRRYVMVTFTRQNAIGMMTHWAPVLMDVTDRPECWTHKAGGGTFGPKGCNPEAPVGFLESVEEALQRSRESAQPTSSGGLPEGGVIR